MESGEQLVRIAEALNAGGMTVIEFTCSTPGEPANVHIVLRGVRLVHFVSFCNHATTMDFQNLITSNVSKTTQEMSL